MKINYVIGDATNPQGKGMKMIVHISNNKNKWGAGFVMALSKKWSEPEQTYRNMINHKLGNISLATVEDDIIVVNMVAQDDVASNITNGISPIRYDALIKTLRDANLIAANSNMSIHMPRIGTGLAGGKWCIIEKIIEETMTVPVTVYDLP